MDDLKNVKTQLSKEIDDRREEAIRQMRYGFVPRSRTRHVDLYVKETNSGRTEPILVPLDKWEPKPREYHEGIRIGTIDLWKYGMDMMEKLYSVPIHQLIKWAREDSNE